MTTAYDPARRHDSRQYYEIAPSQDRYQRDRMDEDQDRPRKLIRYAVAPPSMLAARGPPSPRGPPPPQSSYSRYAPSSGSRSDYREAVPAYPTPHTNAARVRYCCSDTLPCHPTNAVCPLHPLVAGETGRKQLYV